jgi:hypothetical protein
VKILREERASVLVTVALVMPVLLLFLALIIDAGNWFTHERQLRNRAVAAAQAAGLEYGRQWARCTGGTASVLQKTAAQLAIVNAAKSYAGVDFNSEVTDVLDAGILVSPGNCLASPPVTSANVKVTEQQVESLFASFGLPIGGQSEEARVEILRAGSETGFVPLAVEDQQIVKAQARFFNACTGNSLGAPVDLSPLDDASQTVPGMTLWGSPIHITLPDAGPSSFPSGCPGANFDYEPVTVEIRLASRESVDLGQTCDALVAAQFAECFRDVTQVRAFACKNNVPICGGADDDGAGSIGDRPLVFDVTLGGGTCTPDPYYARLVAGASACTFNASVLMDWSDRPGLPSGFQADLVVDGTPYPLSGAGNELGTWIASGIELDSLGPANVRVDWSWYSELPGPGWPCTPANPCEQDGSIVVHRTNLADDPVENESPTDILQLARFSVTASVDPISALHSVHASGSGVDLYFTVGLRSGLGPSQPAMLRTRFPGGRAVVCDPDYVGAQTEAMVVNGCKPPYTANRFDTSYWWNAGACPSPATWFSAPYTNTPWRCLRTESQPGSSAEALADGLAVRTGNESGVCNKPSKYDDYFGTAKTADIDLTDRRFVPVFVVPFGSLKGPADNAVPILEIAYFYITDWGAPHNDGDPCANRAATNEPPPGRVAGFFVSVVVPNTGPTEPDPPCDPASLRPCRAVLVR